jgi:alpha-galactosidase
MRVSRSQVCADGWLQVKHQCLICKTEVEQVDRYSKEKLRVEENTFIPPISKSLKHEETAEVTSTHQSASQALNKEFFLEEFTKLLSTIHHKHATYMTLKDQRFSGVSHSYASVMQSGKRPGGHAKPDP